MCSMQIAHSRFSFAIATTHKSAKNWRMSLNHELGGTQQLCHSTPSLALAICPTHIPLTTAQPC